MWDVRIFFPNPERPGHSQAWCLHDVVESLNGHSPWDGAEFYELGDAIKQIQQEACTHYKVKELGITKIEILPYE